MMMHSASSRNGFTLVELIVSMSLGMVVMAAVFSTYLYLGRNLTRLSYRSTLESQSRKILNEITTDIRNAKSIKNASDTALTLIVYNQDISKGTTPTMEVAYAYDTTGNKLTRDPDGSGPVLPVTMNYDIGDSRVQVSVALLLPSSGKLFSYSTTMGKTYTTAGTGPTFQSTSDLVPMSIKQVAVNFTLQAGSAAIQGSLGTSTSYAVASSQMPLVNRSFPDGS